MSVMTKTVLLLTVSNFFMLTAWYFHLKAWSDKPWFIASLLSWFIAAIEYSVHIPANRIGSTALSLSQLQILQVGMSLLMFIPFAIVIMKTPVRLDYIWAALCLLGTAYFIFAVSTARETRNLTGAIPFPTVANRGGTGRFCYGLQSEPLALGPGSIKIKLFKTARSEKFTVPPSSSRS